MATPEKSTYQAGLAAKFQLLRRGAHNLIHGIEVEGQVGLGWTIPKEVEINDPLYFPGDPHPGNPRRNRGRAGVMGSTREAFNTALLQVNGADYQQAVAFSRPGSRWVVGSYPLDASSETGRYWLNDNDGNSLVSFHMAKFMLFGSMGLYLPRRRTFIAFDEVNPIDANVPIGALQHMYGGVPYIEPPIALLGR